ncbi:hypothetical protein [Chitinimonas taiwanensis]|uniref:Uncharacterized protein n=1 Tax=Chitinimonas taiwanensis DSM 18899 TaxID=1121279 RepID=A0A1K2H9A9_9NEIS|nr:hypothetical protein [Chitinimonas taiwanensis]SFZ72748.1 hypothetical protein SAMN02745887_00709 [Chitinimonas taiwanensis DSM 18899]
MSMLEEFSNSVKAQLYDRVSSPFLGAYAISWLLWNYKIVLIAVSDMKGYEKLSYIENNLTSWTSCTNFNGLYSHWANCNLWSNWVFPLTTVLFYIFWWPYINTKIMVAYKKRQNYHKAMQLKMDKQKPISYQEAIKIRKESKAIREDYEEEVAQIEKQRAKTANELSSSFQDAVRLKEDLKNRDESIEKIKNENAELQEKHKIAESRRIQIELFAIAIANLEFDVTLEYFDVTTLYEIKAKILFSAKDDNERIAHTLNKLLAAGFITETTPATYRISSNSSAYMNRLHELNIINDKSLPIIRHLPSKQSDTPDPAELQNP